ncbi:MAG: glycosyltransferase family 9 protein [Planctomycetota bacterium]
MQLVFHQAALGDFVLAVPTWRRLVRADEPITLVVPWSHGRVAARLLPEARVLDIEMFEFTRLWSEEGPSTVSPAVAEVFGQTTRVLNYVANPQSAWTRNIDRVCGGVPVVTVEPRPAGSWTRPIADWHAEQLSRQGIKLVAETQQTRHGTPMLSRQASSKQSRRWVVHPGSGGLAKCWPIARFAEACEHLKQRGETCVFLLGPAEIERDTAKKLVEFSDPIEVKEIREIDDLCFALAEATHYLGNDAGPTHLAAQLGLPTTAIFGPSDPRVWTPVGPKVDVIAPPEPTLITWLSAEALRDRIDVQ